MTVIDPVAPPVSTLPGEVVPPEGGARDDAEALVCQARDGEVALDPAALVQHLRVGDAPELAGHALTDATASARTASVAAVITAGARNG